MSIPRAHLPQTQTSPSTIPLPRAAHTRSQRHKPQLTRPAKAQAPVLATQVGGRRRLTASSKTSGLSRPISPRPQHPPLATLVNTITGDCDEGSPRPSSPTFVVLTYPDLRNGNTFHGTRRIPNNSRSQLRPVELTAIEYACIPQYVLHVHRTGMRLLQMGALLWWTRRSTSRFRSRLRRRGGLTGRTLFYVMADPRRA